jgi:hypothetical protein
MILENTISGLSKKLASSLPQPMQKPLYIGRATIAHSHISGFLASLVCGWLIDMDATQSEVVVFDKAFGVLNGHVLDGEGLDDKGVSYRFMASGQNVEVFSYSLHRPEQFIADWKAQTSEKSALLKSQKTLLMDGAHKARSMSYSVYWEKSVDFGYRQSVAVFDGFEGN